MNYFLTFTKNSAHDMKQNKKAIAKNSELKRC